MKGIYVNVPQAEYGFFKEFITKMGWKYEEKESILKSYLERKPKDSALTDEEIMDEIYAVRYKR